MWRDLIQNCALTFRRIGHEPRFACAVALTVALGVGANAAMLDTAQQLLFRPLPVPDPSEIVALYNVDRSASRYLSSSYPDYKDLSQRLTSFEELAIYLRLPLSWTESERIGTLNAEAVTANFFRMLKVRPSLGTSFEDHTSAPGWPFVALVSEKFWRDRLARDPAIVGRTMNFEGLPFTVIGVMPETLGGQNVNWYGEPAIWIPMDSVEATHPSFKTAEVFTRRNVRFGLMLGRLRKGASIQRAQSEADVVSSELATEWPRSNAHVGLTLFEAGRAKFWPAYRETLTKSLTAFVGAAGLTFLLACFNLLNLLSQQTIARERDLAVRLSLGGSKGQLVRQLLVEGVIFAAPGFALALLVAFGVQRLVSLFPNMFGVGLALDLTMTPQIVVTSLALSLVMAALFALIPIARLGRVNLATRLKGDPRTMSSTPRGWLRNVPVALQVILSAILLSGATLVFRSVVKGETADLGFQRSRIIVASLDATSRSRPDDGRAALEPVLESLSALNGVRSTSVTSTALLDGTFQPVTARTDPASAAGVQADTLFVDSNFFDAMSIGILAGRGFDRPDDVAHRPLAVVSESLARQLWPGDDAVGRTLFVARGQSASKPLEVIGVAKNLTYSDPWKRDQPIVYRIDWSPSPQIPSVVIQTSVPPESIIADVRHALTTLPSGLYLESIQTADERLSRAIGPERIAGVFLGMMAGLAVLVAGIGLHSTLAFAVAQRRAEIAIRMAVGGPPVRVSAEIVRATLACAVIAACAGAIASVGFTSLLTAQTKGVAPRDWITFVSVALALSICCVAIAAASVRRVMQINPSDSLRLT
jgi:predicted permease